MEIAFKAICINETAQRGCVHLSLLKYDDGRFFAVSGDQPCAKFLVGGIRRAAGFRMHLVVEGSSA
jgi:hypothetical protein